MANYLRNGGRFLEGLPSFGHRRRAPEDPFHIAYCLGTRPEVIRSARLLQLLSRRANLALTVVNSGQHYDPNMLGDFFTELEVPPPDEALRLVAANPAEQTAMIMSQACETFDRIRPDAVCVFGDTNSTLGFALAAVKLDIPLVHVEAGCRSYDMSMPEEVNRRVVDHCASLLLAVSDLGAANLRDEAVPGNIEVVGDPLYDVYMAVPTGEPEEEGRPGLLTLHRPSNVDDVDRLYAILSQVAQASKQRGIAWIFPAHPRTQRSLRSMVPNAIQVVDPLSYTSLLRILRSAPVCLTDSGGLQKEALWSAVPCITVRSSTEWMETIWQGANVLASAVSDIAPAITESVEGHRVRDFSNPYGDGRASERIVDAILRWLLQGLFASHLSARHG